MATTAQRKELASLMDLMVSHEPKVHYAQVRPMATHAIHLRKQLEQGLRATNGLTMDCSESVTLLCKLAGLKDPNGLAYDGAGYTGTMLNHLKHYTDPKNALVGALVVFGPGSGDHVCMVRHSGPDPILFSHGTEKGPWFVKFSEEKTYHKAPYTFLSIANL